MEPGPGPDPAPEVEAEAEAGPDDWIVTLATPYERRPGARRRSTHRRRGKTVLTVGVGLALAVGGSMVAARMADDGQRTDRAATVMLTDDAGPDQPAPLPSQAGTPSAPKALPSAKGPVTVKATGGATKAAGASQSPGGASAPGPAPSASVPGTSGPTTGSPSGGPSAKNPLKSAKPAPSGSGSAQPSASATPAPTPTPTQGGCWFWLFCG